MRYRATMVDGPLQGCYAWLSPRPLDGEIHLFSDPLKSADERISPPFRESHHYEFLERLKAFVYTGKTDIRMDSEQIESEPPEPK